jgi:hypothetical protein
MLTTLLNASLDEDLEPVRIRASWRATAVSGSLILRHTASRVTRRRGLMGVARHCATESRSPRTRRHEGSREVDVVGKTFGAGALEQSQQRSPLGSPGSSSNHDNDTVVRSRSRELEEVIAIARDDDQIAIERVVKNRGVGGLAGKHLARATHLVSKMLEEIVRSSGTSLSRRKFTARRLTFVGRRGRRSHLGDLHSRRGIRMPARA